MPRDEKLEDPSFNALRQGLCSDSGAAMVAGITSRFIVNIH